MGADAAAPASGSKTRVVVPPPAAGVVGHARWRRRCPAPRSWLRTMRTRSPVAEGGHAVVRARGGDAVVHHLAGAAEGQVLEAAGQRDQRLAGRLVAGGPQRAVATVAEGGEAGRLGAGRLRGQGLEAGESGRAGKGNAGLEEGTPTESGGGHRASDGGLGWGRPRCGPYGGQVNGTGGPARRGGEGAVTVRRLDNGRAGPPGSDPRRGT